jgi:hypothetical protein
VQAQTSAATPAALGTTPAMRLWRLAARAATDGDVVMAAALQVAIRWLEEQEARP